MSIQAVTFVPNQRFRIRLAAGTVALSILGTPWMLGLYAVLLGWSGVSAAIRILRSDATWWIDPIVVLAILVAVFVALTVRLIALDRVSPVFPAGQEVRTSISGNQLWVARGDSAIKIQLDELTRSRSGFGLVLLDTSAEKFVLPAQVISPAMAKAIASHLARGAQRPRA